jgi:ATP-dependent Clp protease ATP-binding subunit ClpA
MYLELFLENDASKALLGAFAAAHAGAKATPTRTCLAHLLDELLEEESIRGKLPPEVRTRARAAIAEQIRKLPSEPADAGRIGFDLEALARPSKEMAKTLGAPKVTPLLFLGACVAVDPPMDSESDRSRELLRSAGVTAEMFLPAASDMVKRQDFTFRSPGLGADGLGSDMTAMARAGFWPTCPVIGQDRELENLVVLLNSMRSSAVVVGEPGVGKSALVAGLAWHIAHRTRPLIPPDMDDWTVVRIEAADMMKGAGARGDLEERVTSMLAFFARNPNVVPFFEEVHKLLDTDDTASRSIATAFKVPMAEERFRCIGATTDREYARFIASDDAMNSRFRKILIQEPSEDAACEILRNSMSRLLGDKARRMEVQLSEDAIRTAVKVTSIYQRTDKLPRKAIALLGETIGEVVWRLSRVDAEDLDPPPSRIISGADVRRRFSTVTGIPVNDLDQDRADYFHNLDQRLKARVRGQDSAVSAVTQHLALYGAGFVDQRRPRGRFLFVGPPGVGKTELALSLAEEVMRDRGSLIVCNMAEYAKEDALNKFMGSAPGYIGFGQTPTIFSKVMMRPYSIVVLDEFEKAHAALANPLISILDGKADDSQGRSIDFSQCAFAMTSNAFTQRDVAAATLMVRLHAGFEIPGLAELKLDRHVDLAGAAQYVAELNDLQVSQLLATLGGPDDEGVRALLVAQGGIWTQPLVDRIDRVVVFNALDQAALDGILARMIEERGKSASRPLPSALGEPETRASILAHATGRDGAPSARRLERSLLAWLTVHALGGGTSPLHQA